MGIHKAAILALVLTVLMAGQLLVSGAIAAGELQDDDARVGVLDGTPPAAHAPTATETALLVPGSDLETK
ncbi:hypothetical protein BS78_09G018200 [Paspalum vaginatum]|nr:hypothetical protein BS78_09G018200 [Paspalum vaginatum]